VRIKAGTSRLLRALPVAAVVAGAFTAVALLVGTAALAVYYNNSNANGSNITNSNISNSNFVNSNISNSNINDSTINNSNIATSNINGSYVVNSNTLNSTINDSFVGGSDITGSTVTGDEFWDRILCNAVDTGSQNTELSASVGQRSAQVAPCPQGPPPPQPAANNNTTNNNNAATSAILPGGGCLNSFAAKAPFTNEPSLDGRYVFTAGIPGTYQVCVANNTIYVVGPANAVVTVAHSGSRSSTTITLANGSASIDTAKVPN
jgi:hypothetical protein